jgi:hypothetical protein
LRVFFFVFVFVARVLTAFLAISDLLSRQSWGKLHGP